GVSRLMNRFISRLTPAARLFRNAPDIFLSPPAQAGYNPFTIQLISVPVPAPEQPSGRTRERLMNKRVLAALLVLPSALAGGCGGAIAPSRINPAAAAARAMADYDSNKDGYLDAHELDACPGLKSCLPRYDADRDGRLSRAELEAGLAPYKGVPIGLMNTVCTVTLNGSSLIGADVQFEPESFLADVVKPAHGTTDDHGAAVMQTDGAPLPGCNLGVYRVRISKKDSAGKETLPARYNTATQLGIELGPDARGSCDFALVSAP
ncbi:MAG TPA: hypothetical protein VMS17_19500, partial [Gemmataceae bacterium]|nr:hypothetical protein [Gemmataceae bacterium]